MSVIIGQVKWFNMKAGYGFINVRTGEHTGKDLFVHYTSVKVVNPQYRYLIAGEYVQFNVDTPADGKHEFHAVNVSGIENGPLMCEARRDAAAAASTATSTDTSDKPNRRSRDAAKQADPTPTPSPAPTTTAPATKPLRKPRQPRKAQSNA